MTEAKNRELKTRLSHGVNPSLKKKAHRLNESRPLRVVHTDALRPVLC